MPEVNRFADVLISDDLRLITGFRIDLESHDAVVKIHSKNMFELLD